MEPGVNKKSYDLICKSLDADIMLRTRLSVMLQTTTEEKVRYAHEITDLATALIDLSILYANQPNKKEA
jgi:hypothetical protein